MKDKFPSLSKKLFLSVLITSLGITSVVNAQDSTASDSESNAPKSTSILEAIVRLFKSPENRLITRGDEVCAISPGNLGEQVIWSDRPVFIWQGKIPQSKINVYSSSTNFNHERDEQLIWSTDIQPNTQTIAYAGEKLKPGFIYDWEIIANDKTYRPTFVLMKEPQRKAIAQDIAKIEGDLKAINATAEEMAIAKADYFADKKLWSDALQQLYIVDNASPKLQQKITDIEQYFCA